MRYAECIECGKKEPRAAGVLIGTRCWDCRQIKRRQDNLTGRCEKCRAPCSRNSTCCMECRGNHGNGGRHRKKKPGTIKPKTQPAAEAARARRVIDRDAVLAALMKGKA